MSKTTKNSKKTILTEDLFNANGSATVDTQVLNENVSDDDEVEENKEVDLTNDVQEQNNNLEETSKEQIEQNINLQNELDEVEENKDVKENKDDTSVEVQVNNEDLQIDSKIIVKKVPSKNKKRKNGFNDESYYLD